jgi:hypothetical protein
MTEQEPPTEDTKKSSGEPLCHVCGVGDDGRRLCHFEPNEECPEEIFLHVFCGKTAAILPNVNRPDLEILTKAGVKNKHGTGVSVTLALQRCRSSRVSDASNREQEYYLSKEFERIYQAVTKEPNEEEGHELADGQHGDGVLQTHSVPNPMDNDSSSTSRSHDQRPFKKRKESPKSPYDEEMERLQLVCDRCRGVGYSLIRGVAREDSDEDNFDPTKCSQEQVDNVRVIVITKDRQDRMEEMSKLILGDQHGRQLMTFSTSFSYEVINAWNAFTVRFQEAGNCWQEKFDLLLGFTETLKEHDVWMHDHEVGWGGEKMVRQLALSWKLVLKRNDDELGIDPEYTRPGIVALLEQFKEAVESVELHDGDELMRFDFDS